MEAINYKALLGYLSGEVALTLTAFVIILADVLCRRGQDAAARNHRLAWWTLVGLGVAAFLYVFQFRYVPADFGDGMLVVNPINLFFKLIILVLTAITVFYSMEEPVSDCVGEYYAMLLFAAVGMVLLVGSENLLMIFVSLELLSLSLYVLVGFQKRILRSAEAAVKYFVFGALSAAFLLFGMSYIYGATNALSLSGIAQSFMADPALARSPLLLIGILFALVGFGFKIAVVPFHLWAPDAYEGSAAPVTGFLASGSKVASLVALVKFLLIGLAPAAGSATYLSPAGWHWVPGWAPLVAMMAAGSMIWGNVAAIAQTNLKRLLAYSSIAHAGYILVAVVGNNSWSAPAAYFYIIIYALTNLGAFGIVTALANKVGGDDLVYFTGVWKRAPVLTVLMMIFLLSLAGIPPLAGFFGKFYLFAAALAGDGGRLGYLWLVIIGIATSAVSFYYYLQVLKIFYVKPGAQTEGLISICPCQKWPMAAITILIFLFGCLPSSLLDWIQEFLKG